MKMENCGLNDYQKFWISLNIREDQRDKFEDDYQLAKFSASFWDPKAVKKIDNMDKVKREEEQERRKKIKTIGTAYERPYDPTSTREGIIEELEKQMQGIKDEHDLAVEEHERRMRLNMLKQMSELKQMQEERKKTFVEMEEARPISHAEMQERIKKIKSREPIAFNMDIKSESRDKFLQMTNIKEDDLEKEIEKENNVMSEKDVDKEYKAQQKKLAYLMGLDDEDNEKNEIPNFPNLRRK
jgi:hypothetical protein